MALREAATYARWVDRTHRHRFKLLEKKVEDPVINTAALLEMEAERHLGDMRASGYGHEIRDCVQAQETHEKAQALPPLRGCEASTRLLHEEAELCQQVMQFLELFMNGSNARYDSPEVEEAKFDAFEAELQAHLSEWSHVTEEAQTGVDEEKKRTETKYAAALQCTQETLDEGAAEPFKPRR